MVALRLMPAGVEEIAGGSAGAGERHRRGRVVHVRGGSRRASTRSGPPAAARTPGSARGGDMYWLAMPIAVAGDDVDGVVAVMRPALRITGAARIRRRHAQAGRTATTARVSSRRRRSRWNPTTLLVPTGMGGMAASSGEQGFTLGRICAGKVPRARAGLAAGMDVQVGDAERRRRVGNAVRVHPRHPRSRPHLHRSLERHGRRRAGHGRRRRDGPRVHDQPAGVGEHGR